MARRKKQSPETNEEEVTSRKRRLEPPYGATGDNPYVVYVDYERDGDPCARVLVQNFKARYAAAWFIRQCIGNNEWESVDPIGSRKCIRTAEGVRISMFKDDLEMLLEYKPSAEEAEWENPEQKQAVMRLRFGTQWETVKTPVEYEEDTVEDEETGEVKTVRRRKDKPKKEPREKKPKVDKTGLVTAGELAQKLNVEPRIFRGALRSMGLKKPDGGWAWKPDEADGILKKVAKELKENGKKKKGG